MGFNSEFKGLSLDVKGNLHLSKSDFRRVHKIAKSDY
jgi:hypothetical protein